MKVNKLKDGIYEITNFISTEDQEDLMAMFESIKEEDWWEDNPVYTTSFWYGKRKSIKHPILSDTDKKIKDLFKSYSTITPISNVCRYSEGEFLEAHTDSYSESPDNKIFYGIVIYWNDNYEGGEIYYPEINFTVKPKERSLILHHGSILHKTLPLKNKGPRYFSTAFIRGSLDSPVLLNDIFE